MNHGELRWDGWGREDGERLLSSHHEAWIAEILAMETPLPHTPAPTMRQMALPPSRLDPSAWGALEAIVGDAALSRELSDRLRHARGQSYHDLLHYRSGRLDCAPDAVIYPQRTEQVVAILQWAAERQATVVPYGGGTSVVGGVTARAAAENGPVLTVDTTRMNRVLDIDPENATATAQAGIYGPELEAALAARGFTLGHYPQSFEFSTLGGWIAARGAGQQSNRYGKAEDWFVSARVATPRGLWKTEDFPASAAGPRLGDLMVGSEGTLGVILDATVRLRAAPRHHHYAGFLFRDFRDGINAARGLSQSRLPLAMIRLSDADETRFQSGFSRIGRSPSLLEKMAGRYIHWRGFDQRACLMLVGAEGQIREVAHTCRQVRRHVRRNRGLALGKRPGDKWFESRFEAPYLRDPLLDRGIGVDTLETAASWDRLERLHDAVRSALRAKLGETGIVMAHLSHSYDDGASLYFTFVFPRDDGDPIGQWRRLKEAASEAIVENGGTISHHHGVGEDHLSWIRREKGARAIALLRSIKSNLDPGGILNPGKLLADGQGEDS